MTYAAQKLLPGRQLVTVAELDLTECSLTYSVAPCTAALAAGLECYNTRFTCQDTANFANTTTTHRFITPIERIPSSIAPAYPAIIGKPSFKSSKFDPGGGLGSRATVTIKLKDFTFHDLDLDQYITNRASVATGTFFGRLLARNPHYVGRVLRVRTGYVTEPWDWTNFQDREYVIEKINGPDKKGFLTITGKDLIKQADDERVQIPAPSVGTLSADITDVAGSGTLNSGEGAAYDASGTISIGSEDIIYTISGDTITFTTRGANGTEKSAHSSGDLVQQCKVYTSVNVVDIVDEILKDFVGIDETKIPYDAGLDTPTGTPDEWDDEKSNWLSGHNLTRTISKPTGAKTLLTELCEQTQINIWHNLVEDEIKLKANTPPLGNVVITSLNDNSNFNEDSVQVIDEQEKRLSQVWVYYGKIDNSGDDDAENFSNLAIQQDATREGEDLYGSVRVDRIFATWLDATLAGIAAQLAGRKLARYADAPKTVIFTLDAKDDSLSIGDLIDASTHQLQDVDGSNITQRLQLLEETPVTPGHEIKYSALTSSFSGLYGFIGPNTLNDRTSETEENIQKYAFIAPDSGFFADGEPAYKII